MIDLLKGVRILALSQFGAGPFGTMHLSDLGAEVIKIEDPNAGGDVSRTVPPYTAPGDSIYFQALNRNKRSMTINIKHPEGMGVFHDLVRVSDAVFNNLRGDKPQQLGLTYETLKHFNQKIICCSLSGFGSTGPRRAEPGYDYIMQGLSGWMSLTGDPRTPPAKSGISLADYSAGVIAMVGLLGALLHAERTGKGCEVEVGMLDVAISLLNYLAIWTMNRDYTPERLPDSAHPTLYPAQVFKTKDDYVLVICFKEKFWRALTEVLNAPELAQDPRFESFATRYEHRDALLADLKARFNQRTTQEWLNLLHGKVPCAPCNSVQEALNDPQTLAREMIIEVDHPVFGRLREVRTGIRVKNGVVHTRPCSPLGSDNGPILRDVLGYTDEDIRQLYSAGAIGLTD